jgi:hypothetical protein
VRGSWFSVLTLSPFGGEREPDSALGGSRLRELFAAAGCKFQFDAATIKPLIQLANSELKKL